MNSDHAPLGLRLIDAKVRPALPQRMLAKPTTQLASRAGSHIPLPPRHPSKQPTLRLAR